MPYTELRRIMAGIAPRPAAVVLPIVIVTLCFCAICIHVLIDARRAAWDRAGDTADSLTAAIESDLVRNIETLDLSLHAVIDNLKHPEITTISPELRQLVLFDRSATAKHVGAILVLDAAGRLVLDSRAAKVAPIDLSDRDYFKAHKSEKSSVLYVGAPQSARVSGQHFIGISRRLSNADGSFAGVVAGSLRLTYFEELFGKVALGPDSNITLLRIDGTVLMRWPHKEAYIGLDLSRADIFKELAKTPRGRFDTFSATDGVHRLVVYRQIRNQPIVVGIGQSTREIYGPWQRYAWSTGSLIFALCVLSAALAIFLMRDLRRRNVAEKRPRGARSNRRTDRPFEPVALRRNGAPRMAACTT